MNGLGGRNRLASRTTRINLFGRNERQLGPHRAESITFKPPTRLRARCKIWCLRWRDLDRQDVRDLDTSWHCLVWHRPRLSYPIRVRGVPATDGESGVGQLSQRDPGSLDCPAPWVWPCPVPSQSVPRLGAGLAQSLHARSSLQ